MFTEFGPIRVLAQGERLFNGYDGAFVENYVAQELTAHSQSPLYYWRSKGGKAEIDFLYEHAGRIYPLEVKAGINPRSKSLRSYDLQFSPSVLTRSTLLNLRRDGKILNVPLYAVSMLDRFIEASSQRRGTGT